MTTRLASVVAAKVLSVVAAFVCLHDVITTARGQGITARLASAIGAVVYAVVASLTGVYNAVTTHRTIGRTRVAPWSASVYTVVAGFKVFLHDVVTTIAAAGLASGRTTVVAIVVYAVVTSFVGLNNAVTTARTNA